ncbi:hypothetical protein ACS0TY_005704 [Phlomoides rotata]
MRYKSLLSSQFEYFARVSLFGCLLVCANWRTKFMLLENLNSYRVRRYRVKRVREGLENSLKNRIELIENYVRISSMIEIKVELELDVVVTEIVNNVEKIAQQMEQIMEIGNLEEKWRIQDEANDEAERLLSYDPAISEQLSES